MREAREEFRGKTPALRGLKESRGWNASRGCLTQDEIIVKTRLRRRSAIIIFHTLLALALSSLLSDPVDFEIIR